MSPYVIPGLKYKFNGNYFSNEASAENIIDCMSEFFKIPVPNIKSKKRQREIVYARQWSIYFIKKHTRLTLKKIGAMFYRDHTTVIHSLQAVDYNLNSKFENEYKADFEILKNKFF